MRVARTASCSLVWTAVAGAALALLGGALAGCRAGQRAECELLIDTANDQVQKIESRDASKAEGPEQAVRMLLKTADLYDELSVKVGQLALNDPTLAQHAKAYQRISIRASAATRALAEAVRQQDREAQRDAEGRFAALVAEQRVLVAQVNQYCGK